MLSELREGEVFIDSKHKTDNETLELFVLITFCPVAGFPVAYFLLQYGTKADLSSREESLTYFLGHLTEV